MGNARVEAVLTFDGVLDLPFACPSGKRRRAKVARLSEKKSRCGVEEMVTCNVHREQTSFYPVAYEGEPECVSQT